MRARLRGRPAATGGVDRRETEVLRSSSTPNGAAGRRVLWDSAEASGVRGRTGRHRAGAAAALAGEVTLERFEVVVGFRQSLPARGALVRLARHGAPARGRRRSA